MKVVTRREFLKASGAVLLPLLTGAYPRQGDWERETPLVTSIREYLASVFGQQNMALDFRCINAHHDEEFRIQINASHLYPVASCFKAFLALYYFFYTPQIEWDYGDSSVVYRTVVFSDNTQTGVLLAEMGERVAGPLNAVEKFNDFLHMPLGLSNGLHTWDWPNTPVAGIRDPRFTPTPTRQVYIDGQSFPVDNAFTAADLARGYDFLLRGESFTQSPVLRDAIQATKSVLSIPATDYQSPIERAYPPGYMGKDGILPSRDIATGRVVNDAGIVALPDRSYILAFMCAGESESTAIAVLRQIVSQIDIYESGIGKAG
jgi:hypothetical protein